MPTSLAMLKPTDRDKAEGIAQEWASLLESQRKDERSLAVLKECIARRRDRIRADLVALNRVLLTAGDIDEVFDVRGPLFRLGDYGQAAIYIGEAVPDADDEPEGSITADEERAEWARLHADAIATS